MRTYKAVTEFHVSSIVCDNCGLKEGDDRSYEFHEFISIEHDCGYGSIHGDGNKICIDLCQKCFAEKCGDSLNVIDKSIEANKLEYDDIFDVIAQTKSEALVLKEQSELKSVLKDVLLKNKISNKHELSVALNRVQQLWDAHYQSIEGNELNLLADLICSYEHQTLDD